jgi:hypothetical protein
MKALLRLGVHRCSALSRGSQESAPRLGRKPRAALLASAAALLLAARFLTGCESSSASVGTGVYYGAGFHDPWYYGSYYYERDVIVTPPPAQPKPPPSQLPNRPARPAQLPSIPRGPAPRGR